MLKHATITMLAVLVLAILTSSATAQQCEPQWDNTVGNPGMNGTVSALAPFDDGTGPALYAGGFFTSAGGVVNVNYIAKWDGTEWSPVGEGVDGGIVYSLASFDDGTGSALYVGGNFTVAGGVSANCIAKWDGSEWTPVGGGMDSTVLSLAVFNDGTGPALYAGGSFTQAGGETANHIAKWDGTEWSPVGEGMNAKVLSLAIFDDGSGPTLFAGGTFTQVGGVSANHIAKWDGSEWTPLSEDLSGIVRTLTVFDDGTGPALYAGGFFTSAGGVPVGRIAKWNGTEWTPLGEGVNNVVSDTIVFDDGTGSALYAGGHFTQAGDVDAGRIAKWDGVKWESLGEDGTDDIVSVLAGFNDGTGPALYAGGYFFEAGGESAYHVASWQAPAPSSPSDLNCDGIVDGADLAILLSNWGGCDDCENCTVDLDGDCQVDGADLAVLLSSWG